MTVLVIGGSGYIGSAVAQHLNADTVDLRWFGGPIPTFNVDYKTLDRSLLEQYSHIVLLAGHSSMAMCAGNWQSAWQNNVTNLSDLIGKLNEKQTLVYASSGSVYGSSGINRVEMSQLEPALIEYDLTKQIGELVASGAKCKTIGLRFGTVSGYNQCARSDLMLNAMTKSALENNIITVFNGSNHRSILGIADCVRAISRIIDSNSSVQHDIFNLASFNGSIQNFADSAASILDVPLDIRNEITNNFSFELNSSKFKDLYNFEFKDTAESIINSLLENYNKVQWSNRTETKIYV